MKRLSLILLSLILVFSCHRSSKESIILEENDSVMCDGLPCIPFLRYEEFCPPIHYILPVCKSLPSIREWDSIWVAIHCDSYWRIQDNKIHVENFDTSLRISVNMHAKKGNISKNYFYHVGGGDDGVCREAIERIFNAAHPFMLKASYVLTDECDNMDSVVIKNVEFKNGLAKTYLEYIFLLYPTPK